MTKRSVVFLIGLLTVLFNISSCNPEDTLKEVFEEEMAEETWPTKPSEPLRILEEVDELVSLQILEFDKAAGIIRMEIINNSNGTIYYDNNFAIFTLEFYDDVNSRWMTYVRPDHPLTGQLNPSDPILPNGTLVRTKHLHNYPPLSLGLHRIRREIWVGFDPKVLDFDFKLHDLVVEFDN